MKVYLCGGGSGKQTAVLDVGCGGGIQYFHPDLHAVPDPLLYRFPGDGQLCVDFCPCHCDRSGIYGILRESI